jgi:hypothetical protein
VKLFYGTQVGGKRKKEWIGSTMLKYISPVLADGIMKAAE